jgi:hypothetical protein
MLSVTTQGLREVESFRNRLSREYGRKRMSWSDFTFLNEHLQAIEHKLIEMASNDPRRIQEDEKVG